jgi:DNA-binding LytR/AlgR family response regulator
LNEISEKLNSNFVRIHRSYIVNINHINKITSNAVQISETTISIGKKYKENLLKKMNLF